MSTFFPLSRLSVHFSRHNRMLVWHDRSRTNPCCCGVIRPFLVRKLMIATQMIFSMILQITEVSATCRKLAIIALFPFLWIGTMCASFQLLGISPSSILKKLALHSIWASCFVWFLVFDSTHLTSSPLPLLPLSAFLLRPIHLRHPVSFLRTSDNDHETSSGSLSCWRLAAAHTFFLPPLWRRSACSAHAYKRRSP